ncbi:hypothetical protein JGS22_002855 [Streptomyces sp. P38-E01]|uniref:Uncharacterized protein n=1 Tax=Streptomyces tardus TaxID=2780544 RepID=A0A949JAQ1_9ACTN|nr:hypothetical protein [Streptomyces tardus]MBU7596603.1 hypothetical protein [Streptomyces tardus]
MQTVEQRLGYEPRVSAPQKEETTVDGVSGQILDWMGVSGKRTGGRAGESTCFASGKEIDEYYTVSHIWSIYDLTEGSYRDAMENLREQLPKNGWKITEDGPANSSAKQPQIVAHHPQSEHTFFAEWQWKRPDPRNELIYISVDSRCMKKPQAEAE